MRILHCCLACFYIDGYGYQENILPRQHKLDGNEVEIIASTETYLNHDCLGYVEPGAYFSESGIRVSRLAYKKFLPHSIMRKLRIYEGLADAITGFMPEIIFVHDCQFLDIRQIAEYARTNGNVKIFVDCHTDFGNSAKNFMSKYVLHKIVYRYCAKVIEPFTTKFYGVLPVRCDFLNTVYGIPREKIELLVLGGEDDKIHIEERDQIRERICGELGLSIGDFIIVTGGKLGKNKNTVDLIDGVRMLECDRIKLVIFGSLGPEVKEAIENRLGNPIVRYVGWIRAEMAYDYFTASDLVIFPGSHSVLWEQAVACGVPCVFRDIEGMHHVDTGGNCAFLKKGSAEEIAEILSGIILNKKSYAEMKKAALHGSKMFLYSDIARRSITHRC
jgi:1,2-diacylglycerol 3-alpha-glucosyltransferase